jgi:hypothetical protein
MDVKYGHYSITGGGLRPQKWNCWDEYNVEKDRSLVPKISSRVMEIRGLNSFEYVSRMDLQQIPQKLLDYKLTRWWNIGRSEKISEWPILILESEQTKKPNLWS